MSHSLEKHWLALRAEAGEMAGGLTDLIQRATVYRQIFRDSKGNHVFPLIAAHGAMWAGGQFRFGRRVASLLKWQSWRAADRDARMQRLDAFFNALRDINRRVCIDTYANFHFTARHGVGSEVQKFVPAELCEALGKIHHANRAGRTLTDSEREEVFVAHFFHEQEHVVGPAVQAAFDQLDWPLVRAIARRPRIRFAYFGGRNRLVFSNFASRDERIRNGRRAFQLAAKAGWRFVEQSLTKFSGVPIGVLLPRPAAAST